MQTLIANLIIGAYSAAMLVAVIVVVVRGERARKRRDARLRYDEFDAAVSRAQQPDTGRTALCSCAYCATSGCK